MRCNTNEQTYTIRELIKNYATYLQSICATHLIPIDEEGYWNINVVFINNENNEDETQFDIAPHSFDYRTGEHPELEELWKAFCAENDFNPDAVLEIYIPNI